ncbi:MAG: hypothetical protein JW940_04495 [Polyangiaceae bacterium]|nr:hypothetical protein [Polyangiaceae bacterium]
MVQEETAVESPQAEDEEEEEQLDNDILGPRLKQALEAQKDTEEEESEEEEKKGDEAPAEDEEAEESEGEQDEGEKEPAREPVDLPDDTPLEITVNKKKQVVTLGELKADAQKTRSSTERWKEAAEKEREVSTREAKIRNAEKYFNDVIKAIKDNPLAAAYHLIARDEGDEAKAYEKIVNVASKFVGEHMEWLNLPEEERLRRQNETILGRKEREIERLKREKAEREQKERLNIVVNELTRKAEAAGIKKQEDLVDVAAIYDRYQGVRSIDECIQEYQETLPERKKKLLEALSDDELRDIAKARGIAASSPLGTVKRKSPASTSPAMRNKREEAPPRYFRNFEEARLDAEKHKRKHR